MDRAVSSLRAGAFYAGMSLFTLVFSPLTLLMLPFPFRWRYRVAGLWAPLTLGWLRITCGLDWRVSGRENIPDRPSVVLCKHQSAFETIALQRIFPLQVWLVKKELFRIPVYGWGLWAAGAIGIDRSSPRKALRQLLEQGQERLRRGIWVVVFPEGTRTAVGERRKYQAGGAMLAKKAGCPVVPVAHNAGLFWPRNSLLKRPGTIDIVIGPPIDPDELGAAEITERAREWIEETTDRLCREAS